MSCDIAKKSSDCSLTETAQSDTTAPQLSWSNHTMGDFTFWLKTFAEQNLQLNVKVCA